MPDLPYTLERLRDDVHAFARAREWDRFHSPKNLAMSLAIEAAEVMELFQWDTSERSLALEPAQREALSQEIGDVLIYLVRLADVAGIDPLAAARAKLAINGQRYPVELARGNALKYDRLGADAQGEDPDPSL